MSAKASQDLMRTANGNKLKVYGRTKKEQLKISGAKIASRRYMINNSNNLTKWSPLSNRSN